MTTDRAVSIASVIPWHLPLLDHEDCDGKAKHKNTCSDAKVNRLFKILVFLKPKEEHQVGDDLSADVTKSLEGASPATISPFDVIVKERVLQDRLHQDGARNSSQREHKLGVVLPLETRQPHGQR